MVTVTINGKSGKTTEQDIVVIASCMADKYRNKEEVIMDIIDKTASPAVVHNVTVRQHSR